jgi:hypothetical protein
VLVPVCGTTSIEPSGERSDVYFTRTGFDST